MHKKYIVLLFFIGCLVAQSTAQRVLIEEFTNTELPGTADIADNIDELTDGSQYILIRYHLDEPSGDPFSVGVVADTDLRLNRVGELAVVPSAIVDGIHRATGVEETGASDNVTADYLDSIYLAKERSISFFGLVLNFSDDFSEVIGSSGMVLTNSNTSMSVGNYRALVEKVVDTDQPVGADGSTRFTRVFRGWMTNGSGETIPGNGSFHGWERMDIPSTVVNLNNLEMVVFVTASDGRVLDCVSVPASPAPAYSLNSTNVTAAQENFICDSIVIPSIRVQNTGVQPIPGVAVKTIAGDSTYMDFITEAIMPGSEQVFELTHRATLLPRGTHFIDCKVEYILNAPSQGNINVTNGPQRYMVARAYQWADVDFEDVEPGTLGDIIVRKRVDEAVTVVSAEDIGATDPIGAYGESDHALMVDCWTWPWNEEDAGNVFLQDNRNFAYLYFDHFPLTDIPDPILKFDVASANSPNHKCIEVAMRPWTCTRNPAILRTLTGNDILSTTANTSSRYVPKADDWRTYEVDLYDYQHAEQTHLRLKFTNHVDFTRPNAFYIDNIRIESNQRLCPDGDILLTSQAEVDSFQLLYGDCNTITGDLCIGSCDSSVMSDIRNLHTLSDIKSIEGGLSIINNPILDDATGISGVRDISGDIMIINNDSLAQLTTTSTIVGDEAVYNVIGNAKLRAAIPYYVDVMNGDLLIKDNPLLERMPVDAVHVQGDFILEGNPNLFRLTTSYPLLSVSGDIVVKDVLHWNSLRGFFNMTRLENNFTIENTSIINTYGTWQIDTVGGDYSLINNDRMELIGSGTFPPYIFGKLVMVDNEITASEDIFDGLNYEALGSADSLALDFVLTGNDSLTMCNTEFLCRLVADLDKNFVIADNGPTCDSEEAIYSACFDTVVINTNVLDINNEDGLSVQPNPVHDEAHVMSASATRAVIIDTQGRQVLTLMLAAGENHIDVSQLPMGTYILRSESRTVRFVKH